MGSDRDGRGSAGGHPWHEIALRLLSGRRPDGAKEDLRLFSGGVPEDAPTAIPVPQGMSVVGGIVRSEARYGEPETEVVLDAPVGAEAAVEAYRALMGSGELDGGRWAEQDWLARQGRGFVSRPVVETAVFCRGRRGPALLVDAEAGDDGGSEVRLSLIPAGRDTPCAYEEERRDRGPDSVIPALIAPPEAYEVEGGSASFGGSAESATTALRTDLPPGDLAAHYAAQLTAAGWGRADEGSDGPVAWSSWEVADKDGEAWEGVFVAARFPRSGRYYELQVSIRQVDA